MNNQSKQSNQTTPPMSTPSEEQMQELVCHHTEKTFMFPGSDHHRKHVRLHAVATEMKAALTALQAENKALRVAALAWETLST